MCDLTKLSQRRFAVLLGARFAVSGVGGGLFGMSGRQPHGRTVRQDLKHCLPSYSNVNLFRDCATEQSQAAAEEAMRPPPTAGSARSDSARRALKLSVAAGSASL